MAKVLQHTATHAATHCKTLQHTATHWQTLCEEPGLLEDDDKGRIALQHTATHCNTLQHTATPIFTCNTLQHTATHCNTSTATPPLQHTAT